MSPGTILEAHKYVNGVLNLSQFHFNDITKCNTFTKVNICKNIPTKRSFSKMVTCQYQGLFIDFGFLGSISYDKEGKVIPSSREVIERINRETAWILISNVQTKMYHGDT